MDVVKEERQPCLDINSGKFSAAHNRVHHDCILGCIVVLAEEVVLRVSETGLCPFSTKLVSIYPAPAIEDITEQTVVVGDCIVNASLNIKLNEKVYQAYPCRCRSVVCGRFDYS